MDSRYTKAVEIIKNLRQLAGEDEKLKESILKMLSPYRADYVKRREKARDAARLISNLVVNYGDDETVQRLIERVFFNKNINT